MRFIEKDKITSVFFNENLKELRKFVNLQLGSQPDPLHPDYNSLRSNIKTQIIAQLKNEQFGLCCYCLQRLESDHFHIEHLAPQSAFLNEEVNYYNLFLSCGSNKVSKKHCGHKKDDKVIPKIISFYNPQRNIKCQDLFKYNVIGEILPREGYESMEINYVKIKKLNEQTKILLATIEVLNLNCIELVSIRKKIIDGIINLPDEREKLENTLLLLEKPDEETGLLDSFCELSRFFLKYKISKL